VVVFSKMCFFPKVTKRNITVNISFITTRYDRVVGVRWSLEGIYEGICNSPPLSPKGSNGP